MMLEKGNKIFPEETLKLIDFFLTFFFFCSLRNKGNWIVHSISYKTIKILHADFCRKQDVTLMKASPFGDNTTILILDTIKSSLFQKEIVRIISNNSKYGCSLDLRSKFYFHNKNWFISVCLSLRKVVLNCMNEVSGGGDCLVFAKQTLQLCKICVTV